MQFTYDSYRQLILLLREKYTFSNYHNYNNVERPCVLRHDVDNDLKKAASFALFEKEIGVQATYFILISSDFYNVFSHKNSQFIKTISEAGHEIGLHFDEKKYAGKSVEEIKGCIHYETDLMSKLLNIPITTMSMHRPSQEVLAANLNLGKVINSYSEDFIKKFKYVSDSRMNWREDVEQIAEGGTYVRIHILTHPFWYEQREESMRNKLLSFFHNSIFETYDSMSENFRDLEAVIRREEL